MDDKIRQMDERIDAHTRDMLNMILNLPAGEALPEAVIREYDESRALLDGIFPNRLGPAIFTPQELALICRRAKVRRRLPPALRPVEPLSRVEPYRRQQFSELESGDWLDAMPDGTDDFAPCQFVKMAPDGRVVVRFGADTDDDHEETLQASRVIPRDKPVAVTTG